MTVLSDPVKNLAKIADFDGSGYLEVWTSIRDGGADGILTDKPVHVPITSTGIETPDLVPGPAHFRLKLGALRPSIEGRIVIPATGPVRVMDVIAASILIPEDTPAQLISQVVQAYLAANPVEGGEGASFVADSARPGLFYLSTDLPAASSDGPLALASASYKTAAKAAGTSRLKLLALMDSTGDGFGNPGGPDSWSKVWPLKLAELLRAHLGRPAGGRGWVPVSNPLSPSSYVWRPSTLLPNTATATDPLGSQIGIPGSLWLQRGHATNVDEVQWTLSAGVTAVDVVHTGYGASDNGLVITAANTAASITKNSIGDRVITRVTNPGATIDIHGAAGVGLAALGIVEYVGDESAGVTMWNLSQGSMAAHEYAAWMTNSTYSLKPMIGTYAPHVALVCLGANDFSRARTTTQLTTALETIRSNIVAVSPNTVVVFVLRPVDPTMTTEQTPTATWAQFCTAVQSYATGVGAPVLDLRTSVPASGGGLYLGDKVHWTEAGQNAAAAAALDYMKVGA